MRCFKCGKEIAEGSRECEYCGAPVRPRGTGRGKRRNLNMVGAAAVLLMFGAMSLLCAGISAKLNFMGTSLGLSVPVTSASSVIGLVSSGGFVKFLIIAYIVLTVAVVLMSFAAVFMIITRRRAGAAAGLISSAVSAVMGIVMIIAIFVVNGKYGNSALSVLPSVWMWISVPANILCALFLFVEKDDII